MRSSKYGLGLAIAAAYMAFGASSVSAATLEVLDTDVNAAGSEWSSADTRPGGSAIFKTGPAIAPLGGGSVQIATPTATAKAQLFTDRYADVPLNQIDGIGYSTYQYPNTVDPSDRTKQVAINLRLATDGGTAPNAYMVYEPYNQPGPALGSGPQTRTWFDWDAYNGGQAKWWLNNPGASGCGQATPCTLDAIKLAFPAATIREGANCPQPGNNPALTPCSGSLGFNQGSGNAGALSNADALYVSIAGEQTTFDFEDEVGPTGPKGNDATGTPGTAGAQGPSGTNGSGGGLTPSSTNTTTKRVVVASKSLKVSKKSRKSTVQVTCPRSNGLCEGTIKIVYKGKVIARQAFLVRGARSGKFSVKLSKANLKKIGKSKKVQVGVFSRDLAGAASSTSKTVTLKTVK